MIFLFLIKWALAVDGPAESDIQRLYLNQIRTKPNLVERLNEVREELIVHRRLCADRVTSETVIYCFRFWNTYISWKRSLREDWELMSTLEEKCKFWAPKIQSVKSLEEILKLRHLPPSCRTMMRSRRQDVIYIYRAISKKNLLKTTKSKWHLGNELVRGDDP